MVFIQWFVQEGWAPILAALNLLLIAYVHFWMRRAAGRWEQTRSMYQSLSERYQGAFRALDSATRDQRQSTEAIRRLSQEIEVDATLIRDKKLADELSDEPE